MTDCQEIIRGLKMFRSWRRQVCVGNNNNGPYFIQQIHSGKPQGSYGTHSGQLSTTFRFLSSVIVFASAGAGNEMGRLRQW
jgi:hypothetical protein